MIDHDAQLDEIYRRIETALIARTRGLVEGLGRLTQEQKRRVARTAINAVELVALNASP